VNKQEIIKQKQATLGNETVTYDRDRTIIYVDGMMMIGFHFE